MKRISRSAVSTVCLFAALASCQEGRTVKFMIGGDKYEVPADRLIEGSVSFLPASQNDALRFNLGTESAGEGFIMVSAQDAEPIRAVPGALALSYRNGACVADTHKNAGSAIRRNVPHSAETQWEYVSEVEPRHPLASCYLGANGNGRCLAFGRFRDTIYSIRFPDSRIADLNGLQEEAEAALESWYVQPS